MMRIPCTRLFTHVSAILALGAALLAPAGASINLFAPGTEWHPGTDGAFAPTSNVEIDLSQAVTGVWDQDNTANAGKGVYDPAKWAVVFKYSSVNIPAGVTVTFKNHDPNAPVVWLVNGDITVNGNVNVNGKDRGTTALAEGGPGGFRGGNGYVGTATATAGFGPGGSPMGEWNRPSYGTIYEDRLKGPIYGNPMIVPLIGGSGGSASDGNYPGGGGGGAFLIASNANLTISGSITSYGGFRPASGGAIRLICDQMNLMNSGEIQARGNMGGDGRIRIEPNAASVTGVVAPQPSYAVPADPPVIWPQATQPTVRIAKVGTRDVPADPKANLNFPFQDVGLQTAAPIPVRMEASNVPVDGTWKVYVRVVPRNGQDFTTDATLMSGDATASVWEATITAPQGFSALQARAYKQ